MDFEKIREKVESQQEESESTLSKQVNEMIGKYQMEGMEYLIKPERKHAFSCLLTKLDYLLKRKNYLQT